MATVKVKFRKSSVEGKAGSIYYQLCHKQSNRQITTRMHILPQWWDAEKETFISEADNNGMSARYQRQIEKDLQRIRRILCEWDGERLHFDGCHYPLSHLGRKRRHGAVLFGNSG